MQLQGIICNWKRIAHNFAANAPVFPQGFPFDQTSFDFLVKVG